MKKHSFTELVKKEHPWVEAEKLMALLPERMGRFSAKNNISVPEYQFAYLVEAFYRLLCLVGENNLMDKRTYDANSLMHLAIVENAYFL